MIAGLFFQGVPPLLDSFGLNGNLIFVLLGVGMIQTIATAPRGIAGQLESLARKIRRKRGQNPPGRTTGTETGVPPDPAATPEPRPLPPSDATPESARKAGSE